jgi:hypothetical protein
MSDFSEDEAQDMELWVFSSLVFFFFTHEKMSSFNYVSQLLPS